MTGKTRVLAVLGYPVDHSLSPAMHNPEFERLGLDYVYVPMAVAPEYLEAGIRGLSALGLAGCNLTIPHKQKVLALLDDIEPEATIVGAVNTVKFANGRSTGYNTDVHGWMADIQQDILLRDNAVCVIGAGGASRAICVGACLGGARSVFICNRTRETAGALGEVLQQNFPEVKVTWDCINAECCRQGLQQCDIIVNTTPVGMTSQPGIPFPAEWLMEKHYVYDTIYVPAETELLRAARRLGCPTRNGLGMLARQGAMAFEIWTGHKPDVDRMEMSLRKALG